MILADWAILAAIFLPILTVGLAKYGGRGYDNASPRAWADSLTGWRQRAEWAHRNHYESLPGFAAAVLLAQMLHAPAHRIDVLAWAFIGFRVLYTGAYIGNVGWLRSLLYALAFICMVRLFELAALM